MYKNKKIVVVMPAYNAAKTLVKTYNEVMAQEIVDWVVIVDDASHDTTVDIARKLPQTTVSTHPINKGYGANQKTCYKLALNEGADIIVMVHPDYQYTPKLIPAMVSLIGTGVYHCVLGSRILGGYAVKGGMPVWRYIANRFLTLIENLFLNAKLSEFHTGYRAYSRELLLKIPFENNSDDFIFDNQVLTQIHWLGYTIAEVTCPTLYSPDASSITFSRSVKYGLECLIVALVFRLAKMKIIRSRLYATLE
ncbi:glycosyltransferase family 2 protein [candidate division CSSED10-310 bacterium]|uniref:Glycosyltransferase family 2 protein n=1 Tax=candidate division CSSED10-310 bacterium TaxID=2855610 RepID=A0ABV6Z399_UNCC1